MRLRRTSALVVLSVGASLAVTVLGFAAAALVDRVRTASDPTGNAAGTVPLSPLTARWRVGRDWPERRDITTGVEPVGEMDDLAAYARPGFDPDGVAPLVRAFYERTAEFDMAYAVRWHAPFRLGAALASPLTTALGQLNLPGRSTDGGRLHSRFAEIRPGADPREGVRAWVRTDDEGTAVFVAIYASHVRDGERFVNIAVPLPFGNLSTVLRIDHLADGQSDADERDGDEWDGTERDGDERDHEADAGTGVRLHTDGPGDPGLYLRTPVGPVELPMDQAFTVRVAPADEDADLVATHEMWLLGSQFLTVRYRLYASAGWP